ncbi:cupin domain-containing protein [Cytobacillus purgationiresistens]|uniref:Mannose-6-phosphate isomerase-like protein (Cupin superfamily) n=1 Tax=Cytobacillus purgationiresistens TaxID=863449 RepID=A0ABU0APW9_9BACI|nr:cupin domain-containing protein [Cytobacillus purgationiresistens]MDQ0272899.1 mannose-6-phosphate isomerase-like protein (cupin superfamily) [Cytobacillus purgationiresistens]
MYYHSPIYPYQYYAHTAIYNPGDRLRKGQRNYRVRDHGAQPYVVNIDEATKSNHTYRTALWTGTHLQVTLMSINVGDDIGLEIHPATDQFLRIEQGQGVVQMGDQVNYLHYVQNVHQDDAIMIPAGKWHNVTNTGNVPLKLYSIYAPPHHPHGTVQQTKAIAMEQEENHRYLYYQGGVI